MTVYQLKNDYLTLKVNSLGAEMNSITNNEDSEFIWQADKNVWGRHAPVLFPIVGRLKDDHYFVDGKEFNMTQHGFARDQEFSLDSQTDSKLVLSLTTSEASLEKYPYHFKLRIIYQLVKDTVQISYLVDSLEENDDMYFSIGAHPGFSVPFDKGLKFEDYKVSIDPAETRTHIPIDNHLIDLNGEKKVENQNFDMTRDYFVDDAVVYRLNDPAEVTIYSDKSDHKLTLDTGNAKFFGMWSTYPDDNGKFMCIEPWWGLADKTDSDNNFKNKYAINKLAPKEQFEAYFSISVK
ncbi:aldose 1-epimerase family protein [Companilactobacillus futsaii]|uniref:Aldose 1-epimerase family protein n=2 Tax=Companilactobacillus futsaii TaxID=938155 RepID=A0A5B7T2N4_9LACO|nr:aldose 1-epimerase family protein [Companilactobacillus futsaii]KRK91828.1 aldose epimerase [Companilactobacillus futsaii JCM 17355]QCX24799.1 aldose 1-epimerase family protein [Companilactobacillus futsaii]